MPPITTVPGALVDHHPGPREDLDLDGLNRVEQSRPVFVGRGHDLHPTAVDRVCASRSKCNIDGGRHALGGVKIGIVEHHADGLHLIEIEGDGPLHHGSAGNPRRSGMVHLLAIAGRGGHVSAQHQRALRLGVDLAVGSVERRHQQDPAFERARVAGRRNRNVHPVSRPAERRQRGHDEDRSHVLHLHVAGASWTRSAER